MNERQCRLIVKERSEGFCERCTSNRPLTMHHRKKRSQGGLWTPENIVAVCGDGVTGCHGWFEHNPNDAAKRGWHVRPWEDPAEVPVKWRGSRWVLLTTDGAVVTAPGTDSYGGSASGLGADWVPPGREA